MNKIWAKQLVLGAKTWNEVPTIRKSAIKIILQEMIENEEITEEQYVNIVGEVIS